MSGQQPGGSGASAPTRRRTPNLTSVLAGAGATYRDLRLLAALSEETAEFVTELLARVREAEMRLQTEAWEQHIRKLRDEWSRRAVESDIWLKIHHDTGSDASKARESARANSYAMAALELSDLIRSEVTTPVEVTR